MPPVAKHFHFLLNPSHSFAALPFFPICNFYGHPVCEPHEQVEHFASSFASNYTLPSYPTPAFSTVDPFLPRISTKKIHRAPRSLNIWTVFYSSLLKCVLPNWLLFSIASSVSFQKFLSFSCLGQVVTFLISECGDPFVSTIVVQFPSNLPFRKYSDPPSRTNYVCFRNTKDSWETPNKDSDFVVKPVVY